MPRALFLTRDQKLIITRSLQGHPPQPGSGAGGGALDRGGRGTRKSRSDSEKMWGREEHRDNELEVKERQVGKAGRISTSQAVRQRDLA